MTIRPYSGWHIAVLSGCLYRYSVKPIHCQAYSPPTHVFGVGVFIYFPISNRKTGAPLCAARRDMEKSHLMVSVCVTVAIMIPGKVTVAEASGEQCHVFLQQGQGGEGWGR